MSIKLVRKPLKQLAEQYFLVAQCWTDPRKAQAHKMSVGKALRILRMVRQEASGRIGGVILVRRVDRLMNEIVHKQEDPPELLEALERNIK